MGMQMGIRCRSLGKILKQILRAYHRQLCENVGLGFVNMWTYIKGSCIIYVIIMKVFGSRPKLVIIGKFCELTHFLSWWQRGVFKESGFGVTLIRMSGSTIYCFWALGQLFSGLGFWILKMEQPYVSSRYRMRIQWKPVSSVPDTRVTHRRCWVGVSTLHSNAKGKLHPGRRVVCSQKYWQKRNSSEDAVVLLTP